MRRNSRHKIVPISIQYFPRDQSNSISTRHQWLATDVAGSLFPYGHRTNDAAFSIQWYGNENEILKAKTVLRNLGRYKHLRADKEIIAEAISNIAQSMLINGSACYELIKSYDKDETDSENGFVVFHEFTTTNLFHIPGYFIQTVPLKSIHELKKIWNWIPSKKVWKIDLPSSIGGKKVIRSILSKLPNNIGFPNFYKDETNLDELSLFFDIKAYVKLDAFNCGRRVQEWGYGFRNAFREFETEYYLVYRELKLYRIKTLLRNHILQELNNLFATLGFNATVKVSGLPSPEDYQTRMIQLNTGEITFEEALA